MDLGPVVPIVVIVLFWFIAFVGCFVSFRRMLRVPTEAEIEAAHEAAIAEEGAHTH
jgi:hypothetical protein